MLTLAKLPHPPCETPPIKAWSFSRLISFEECPYREYLKAVAKEPEPPRDENHPLERGNRIHKEAEEYLLGQRTELPPSLNKLSTFYQHLLNKNGEKMYLVTIEDPWAFTEGLEPTDWWAPNAWLRVKLDHCLFPDPKTAVITDHKTGKSYGKEIARSQQAQLYAAAGFVRYPDLETIDIRFAYIDEGKVTAPMNYTRSLGAILMAKFIERAKRLTSCVIFEAKPNRRNCNYCPYGRNRGTGACNFSVE